MKAVICNVLTRDDLTLLGCLVLEITYLQPSQLAKAVVFFSQKCNLLEIEVHYLCIDFDTGMTKICATNLLTIVVSFCSEKMVNCRQYAEASS